MHLLRVVCFGFFLFKEWQKGAIVLHPFACRKSLYKVKLVKGPAGKTSATAVE